MSAISLSVSELSPQHKPKSLSGEAGSALADDISLPVENLMNTHKYTHTHSCTSDEIFARVVQYHTHVSVCVWW